MEPRLNFFAAAPDLLKQVAALNQAVEACGLERSLLHLVKLRASQINGCSYCVEMHSREARADGESEQRLYLVAAWRESPLFTARERAALEWTEAVTRLSQAGVSEDLFRATRFEFSETDLTRLTVAIGMINVWNRLSVPFQAIHPVARAAA
ncbi:carboxymuconolactone decarboxylase family protein [Solirhodobacter olei]|uniref:carboxymuconolactone decarboxylase family protein n=1 Tax=Solirhodobacter olei TaxID=2493082 RepID=UPI000FD97EFB|nr:carboxymuconolactone decarboxylase family protein [Solirhodobacter olei]